MYRTPLLLLTVILLLLASVEAFANVRLLGMTKEEEPEDVRLALRVSTPVIPSVALSGQRVDVTLPGAGVSTGLRNLPENGKLIKALLVRRGDDLVVSFLFRQPPLRVEAAYERPRGEVVVRVYWQDMESRRRIAIDRAPGKDWQPSPHAANWPGFFKQHQTPFVFELKPVFSLPHLPPVSGRDDIASVPRELLLAVERGTWREARELLTRLDLATGDDLLRVIAAEVLLRSGEFRLATPLLQRLTEQPGESPLRARAHLLLAYRQAGSEPFSALYQLTQTGAEDVVDNPLVPLAALLRAELHLATGYPQRALESLESTQRPESLADLAALARAAALTELGRHQDALEIYDDLSARYGELTDPFNLEHFCRALYHAERFAEAALQYARLAERMEQDEARALAWYAQARALLDAGQQLEARLILERIEDHFPRSLAARLALMKLADLGVLAANGPPPVYALLDYQRLEPTFSQRQLREEALLKAALVQHMRGDNQASVEILDNFLRQYYGGSLAREARTLLSQLLPGVVEDMIAAGDPMTALVLVDRHREVLLNHRVSGDFLQRLAQAFMDLELPERAARIYLFMIDGAVSPTEAQRYFLPLVQTQLRSGHYPQAIEFAHRYRRSFPQGPELSDILALKAQALRRLGRLDEAADLLISPDRPPSRALDVLAGHVCLDLGRYEDAVGCLLNLEIEAQGQLLPEERHLLAEALRRAGRIREARIQFEKLRDETLFADEATFRSAQLAMAEGERAQALKLLRQLAEEGADERWRRMAAETLALARL